MRRFVQVLVLIASAALFAPGTAKAQSFSAWSYSQQKEYYYRICTYPDETFFYVIYKPAFTQEWVFCFNPYTRRYWCACPTIYNPTFGAQINSGAEIFITIVNVQQATTPENAGFPDNPQASQQATVPFKNANGQVIHTVDDMPNDLPPT